MTRIDVFYQGEGIRDIEHIEVEDDKTFAALKAILAEKHNLHADVLIFLEDCDEPIVEAIFIRDHAANGCVKVHVHRCRQVEVAVTFNGETIHHRFGSGTTVAHVKRWAAERKFGMSADEASEHVLQISGGTERPTPGSHLGAIATCPKCKIAFDLVPDQRVNGCPSPEVWS